MENKPDNEPLTPSPELSEPVAFENKPKKSNKKIFKIIAALVIVFVVGTLISKNVKFIGGFPIFKKDKSKIEKKDISTIPIPVKAYRVSLVDFTDSLPALGTVKGYHEIELKFSEPGYIEYVNFKDGEKVIEGDIIASQDQREALLKLEYAKNEMEKNQLLFDLGSITKHKFNQSKLEYQSARLEYEKTNLIAPYDGYIGSLEIEKGSYVTPNDEVGSFVNLTDAYVEFGVIEKDITKVRVGQPVSMSVDAYPQDIFEGELDSISPIVEGKSRTFRVRARITNEDEKLRAGMFGRASVLIYEKDNAIVIPSSAFKRKGDEYFVYVVHPELSDEAPGETDPEFEGLEGAEQEIIFGSIEIRPIQVAYTTPDAVELKAGLEEGELLVADIQQEFEEKTRVEVTEIQENLF